MTKIRTSGWKISRIQPAASLRLALCAAFLSWIALNAEHARAAPIKIDVGSEPRQTFQAFGWSVPRRGDPYTQGLVTPDGRVALNQALFETLNTNVVRLWYGFEGIEDLVRRLVDTNIIGDARDHGVEHLLLSFAAKPDDIAEYHPEWLDGSQLVDIRSYVDHIAELIARLRDQYGIVIDALGMINEPGADVRINVPEIRYISMLMEQRHALDKRGLHQVKILGFEYCCPGASSRTYYRLIGSDNHAAKLLSAMATHSYGTAVPKDHGTLALQKNWEYWQTESGGARSPADIGARFLNDLNNAVTHWMFFLGPVKSLSFHALAAPRFDGGVDVAPHYWPLALLSQSFAPGTKLRRTTSSLEGDMDYRRGLKGKLYTAAGVREDGKWVVGLANPTGSEDDQWYSFHAAESHRVVLRIAELAPRAQVRFTLCIAHAAPANCGKSVILRNGVGAVSIGPGEVLSLIQDN